MMGCFVLQLVWIKPAPRRGAHRRKRPPQIHVKAQVRVHEYPDGHLAVFHGPRCLARYRADGETIDDDRLQAA